MDPEAKLGFIAIGLGLAYLLLLALVFDVYRDVRKIRRQLDRDRAERERQVEPFK